MIKNKLNSSPKGMRSYLPEKASELDSIKENINRVFNLWGYKPIITPTLEYYDSLLTGMGQKTKKEFYKLIDYEGNILALRPEMTAPIARTIAGRLNELDLPLRFSYSAPVFRYDSPQVGKNREIFQMGIELIGKVSAGDVESIIIAIEAIKSSGIKNFRLNLGHTGYLDGILNKANVDNEVEKKLKSYLNKKDLVGYKKYINELSISDSDKKALLTLPELRGANDILNRAEGLIDNKMSSKSIEKLKRVYNSLIEYGVGNYISFDLSLIRGLDYYTGIVFEGFNENLGYTICGGGRYDNLLKKYGDNKIPAVGFAIGLERVWLALKKEGHTFNKPNIDGMVIFPPQNRGIALKTVRYLHKKGLNIVIEESDTEEGLVEKFKNQGVEKIISFFNYQSDKSFNVYGNDENVSRINLEEGWVDKIWNKL